MYVARPAWLAAGLALAILALDLLAPEGIGVPFLYVVVVVAALWSPRERFALAAAVGITALAAADILLVWGTIIWMIIAIWKYYRWVAIAQLPYFAWVSIATVLQLSISWRNWAG